jgi:lysophospholipase L1-like esterase
MSSLAARIGLHAGLLLFSSCVALGAAELTVRAVLPQYISIQTDRAIWERHPTLGWVGKPGIEVLQGFDDAQMVPVKINSLGFREDEIPYERTPGRTRLLVLGDSVAFGFGTRVEDRFSEVIERTRPDLELVNLGVSGYSTDQELLLFREEGIRYAPDIVLLIFVSNDAAYNGRPLGHGHPKPVLSLREDALVLSNVPVPRTRWPVRVKYALQRNSALFNLARERLRSVARQTSLNRLAGDELLAGAGSREADFDPLLLTEALIEQLNDEVATAGARLLVVSAATAASLDKDQPSNPALLEWCETSAVACLDTLPAFRAHVELDPDANPFLQDRSHWSAAGHAVAAGAVLEALNDLGWLPPAAR